MEIVNAIALARAWRKHPDARAWLENWLDVVERADWKNIQDVRKDFPSADGVPLKSGTIVTVFNVRGNQYRLLTTIVYRTGVVYVALTHAEYDKGRWKDLL